MDGYDLWFTRDERRSRAAALRPALYDHGACPFVAPRDPEGLGTWLGVNASGLTVGLGNGTALRQAPADSESRGRIVWHLLAEPGIDAARRRLDEEPLSRTRPFILLLLAPGAAALLVHWDGLRLRHEVVDGSGVLLSTSSLGPAVESLRRSRIESDAGGVWTPDRVEAIHRSSGGSSPSAVCVERPDVSSVSLSRIRVGGGMAEFVYTPGVPSRTNPDAPMSLRLQSAGIRVS